jgi:hypothetical protein
MIDHTVNERYEYYSITLIPSLLEKPFVLRHLGCILDRK